MSNAQIVLARKILADLPELSKIAAIQMLSAALAIDYLAAARIFASIQ